MITKVNYLLVVLPSNIFYLCSKDSLSLQSKTEYAVSLQTNLKGCLRRGICDFVLSSSSQNLACGISFNRGY